MPSLVIVNADDFGLSAHTNAVILHGFQAGLISSATAMANMPAFNAACSLAQLPALHGRIGLHFNLTYGRPLSEAIGQQPRLCTPSGEFDLRLKRRTLRLRPAEREAIEQELHAQWQHCLNQGLMPSHLDSHQHVHNIWPIGEIVARFAAREGVPVRLARNLGHNINPAKRVFKALLNRRIKQLCGVTADYVCTPVDLRAGLVPDNGILELVAHPSALGGHDFGDAYLGTGESLKALVEQRLAGVPRVGYGSLGAGKVGVVVT
ncbi:ChbG/HpnK family deacetylase [Pseudomonas rubra]|uniref:ChbG/HpnK family deacetylase n=1 Tax=Pseudomonas rubra TaxID=2942627 RepID=A0ABT5PD75_9PSED|nr:ChbG/HpnK family deacetylase [Pseudomonas rubra]MDD1015904.1 ChbG/HpnK family deacetylase [Pseudomonas rubra]MDD1041791.1 ChbG/HpnK family deacetylase [Pseudomonas rubra]MDD1154827.1 ChbG/HpnK family deacetylase [Pseudomonas rubra]